MLRFLAALALTLSIGTAAAVSVPAPAQVKVHTIAMKVMVDGEIVMTPNVRTLEGQVGTLTVSGENGAPGYTLEFEVGSQVRRQIEATTLKGSLYRTVGERRELLAAPDMAFRAGSTPSMQIGAEGMHGVSIEVVSHGISLEDAGLESATVSSCDAPASDQAMRAPPKCCGSRCGDGSGNNLKCCNVISCCGCGACCDVL